MHLISLIFLVSIVIESVNGFGYTRNDSKKASSIKFGNLIARKMKLSSFESVDDPELVSFHQVVLQSDKHMILLFEKSART